MSIQTISNLGGLLSLGITMLCIVVGGFYLMKTGANNAQQSAINAMQSELATLRGRIEDLKKENTRQAHVIETICAALKMRGLLITISGEMISIEDRQKSTVVRIQEEEK
jgi:hypothetical protein